MAKVTELTAESSREQLTAGLHDLNHCAATTHPSPEWDGLHEAINQLLDWLVGR